MSANIPVSILVMFLTIYGVRVLPLTLLKKEIKSPFIRSFLYYVPYVTLAVMTFPAILIATANIWSAAIGFAIALILAWNRKSLICVSLFSCAGVFLVELLTGL